MIVDRYNIVDGNIKLTNERKKPIKIKELLNYFNLKNSSQIIENSIFEAHGKTFKILQITNDTKHFANKNKKNIKNKLMILRWDKNKKKINDIDFVIAVYFTKDKFVSFIIDTKTFLNTKNREINFFINLDKILEAYCSDDSNAYSFSRKRNGLEKVNFIQITSNHFEKIIGEL